MTDFFLKTPDELVTLLETKTPLIETNYQYKAPLTEMEILDHEHNIASLTLEILKQTDQIKQLQDEVKTMGQERNTRALIIESRETERIAPKAVKFYDPDTKQITVFVETETGYQFERTRDASPVEVDTWKRQQAEIRQLEIEQSQYRRDLYKIAGYGDGEV